jgi:hypothetical protein
MEYTITKTAAIFIKKSRDCGRSEDLLTAKGGGDACLGDCQVEVAETAGLNR